MTSGTLALTIVVLILVQVGAVALLGWVRRRRAYRALSDKPHVAAAPAAGPGWEGFREFSVQRREHEDAGRTICSFYLVPADGGSLPDFKPGQYLTFRLTLEDPDGGEPKTVVRCYSLSDAPRPDRYRVSIKRVPPPAGHPELPPGRASNFFHDHVREGGRVLVKAPAGHFHLQEDEPLPIVLIGGGIGITPMLSILNTVLERGLKREVTLFYGVRNGDEHIMKAHLRSLAAKHPNFHLHVCYSAPKDTDIEGIDYQHRGRVDLPLLRGTLQLARHQFYLCGPNAMMESLVPALEEWGVDSGDIHYESFGPATLTKRAPTAPSTSDAPPASVTFSHSGKCLPWDPATDSLLAFAEANGIDVPSGCRAGSCGCCRTALTAGEVEYNQAPDVDVDAGHCLLCITKPKGDLTLAA